MSTVSCMSCASELQTHRNTPGFRGMCVATAGWHQFIAHVCSWVKDGCPETRVCSVHVARATSVLVLQGHRPLKRGEETNFACMWWQTIISFLCSKLGIHGYFLKNSFDRMLPTSCQSGYFSTELLPSFPVSLRFYSLLSVEVFCWRTCIKFSQCFFQG